MINTFLYLPARRRRFHKKYILVTVKDLRHCGVFFLCFFYFLNYYYFTFLNTSPDLDHLLRKDISRAVEAGAESLHFH